MRDLAGSWPAAPSGPNKAGFHFVNVKGGAITRPLRPAPGPPRARHRAEKSACLHSTLTSSKIDLVMNKAVRRVSM